MPGIFHECDGEWQLVRVASSPSLLQLAPIGIEPGALATSTPATDACVLRHAGNRKWAVLVSDDASVRHNGIPISAGLRILDHGDALGLDGHKAIYFSTEERAHVETFVSDTQVSCPRCRGEVGRGDSIVRCPSCSVIHHETSDRNCWTYAETCALCSQATAQDAGLRWTPAEL